MERGAATSRAAQWLGGRNGAEDVGLAFATQ